MTFLQGSVRKRLSDVLTLVSLVLTSLFLLSGCLLNRVQQIQAQSCDFERHFTFETGPDTSWTFHEPVLLKSDVERMLGLEPRKISQVNQQETHHYRFAQVSASGERGETLDFEMRYVADRGEWRLASVYLPGVVGLLVDRAAAERVAAKACDAEWSWSIRGITQSLDAEDLDLVPGRSELLAVLGTPTRFDAGGRSLTYAFRGLGPDEQQAAINDVLAEFTIQYDGQDRPHRMASTFRGLRADADFRSLEARLSYRGGGVKE